MRPTHANADLDISTVWESPTITIVQTCWDPARHPLSRITHAQCAAVEIMRSGMFLKSSPRETRTTVGDVNSAVLFNAGEPCRIKHAVEQRNQGTTLRIPPERIEPLLSAGHASPGATVERPFATWCASVESAALAMHRGLLSALRARDADSLEIEDRALHLVMQLIPGRTVPETAAARRARKIQELLATHWQENLNLERVALEIGCSPWRACRDFSDWVGLPLHRYLKRLRLREALARLSEGATDILSVALECGFASHSYFTTAFRAEFGAPPSLFRKQFDATCDVAKAERPACPATARRAVADRA